MIKNPKKSMKIALFGVFSIVISLMMYLSFIAKVAMNGP